MTTIKARFDGKVFVPQEPVALPEGFVLEIAIPTPEATAPAETTLAALARLAEQFPQETELPTDLATQHDHYLYGTPEEVMILLDTRPGADVRPSF